MHNQVKLRRHQSWSHTQTYLLQHHQTNKNARSHQQESLASRHLEVQKTSVSLQGWKDRDTIISSQKPDQSHGLRWSDKYWEKKANQASKRALKAWSKRAQLWSSDTTSTLASQVWPISYLFIFFRLLLKSHRRVWAEQAKVLSICWL